MLHEFDINHALPAITMHVKFVGMGRLRFRLWLGRKLIILAAWVMGIGLEVNIE